MVESLTLLPFIRFLCGLCCVFMGSCRHFFERILNYVVFGYGTVWISSEVLNLKFKVWCMPLGSSSSVWSLSVNLISITSFNYPRLSFCIGYGWEPHSCVFQSFPLGFILETFPSALATFWEDFKICSIWIPYEYVLICWSLKFGVWLYGLSRRRESCLWAWCQSHLQGSLNNPWLVFLHWLRKGTDFCLE